MQEEKPHDSQNFFKQIASKELINKTTTNEKHVELITEVRCKDNNMGIPVMYVAGNQ